MILRMLQVPVPGEPTTYWCQATKISNVVTLTKKQHIIEVRFYKQCLLNVIYSISILFTNRTKMQHDAKLIS